MTAPGFTGANSPKEAMSGRRASTVASGRRARRAAASAPRQIGSRRNPVSRRSPRGASHMVQGNTFQVGST
ncbi:MAG: hypothetical protein L6R43_06015 [Planctomycetes bacterium]|nr:hypothetical protein [Planctomycetota bacterium]